MSAVEKIELNEQDRRGRIVLSEIPTGLPNFAFDSNGSKPANEEPYRDLAFAQGVTAVSWSGVTQELLFYWSRLFSGDEIAHTLTSVLARKFGLNPTSVCASPDPKFPEETIAIQHQPGGEHTFVHTRIRLCPVSINRTSARSLSVPLFEKLRILEGITINLHPFLVHVIAKDERTSVEVSRTAVPSAIVREFKLQAANQILI